MAGHICTACGVRYPDGEAPPARCIICEDERQFVPKAGQRWISPEQLAAERANAVREVAPGILGLSTTPSFAIGQRALLLRSPAGNVLWDCLSLLDRATVEIVQALGGLQAIAVSHPHFYAAMDDWAAAFGCPVLVHADDREWTVRRSRHLEFWDGERHEALPGVVLHRLGGHFPGSAVLHWEDRRILCTGDTVHVMPDRRHLSFMWSYPNQVPLPASTIRRIGARLDALDFDAIYAAFTDREIERDAKAVARRSVARYLRALEGENPSAAAPDAGDR